MVQHIKSTCITGKCIFYYDHKLTYIKMDVPCRFNHLVNFYLKLSEHLSLYPVFSGVRVTRSLVLYVCFADRCLSFYTLSFGHCVVCSFSIYGFWLHLWYLQTLRTANTYYRFSLSIFYLLKCAKRIRHKLNK